MKKLPILLLTAASLSLTACGDSNNADNNATKNESSANATENTAINVSPTDHGPAYPNADLQVASLNAKAEEGSDSVTVEITYKVSGFELKQQTADANDRTCNNSKEGQHIHFILDNTPYVALYEPKHTFKVAKNSEHTLLSFLSRSYHLSVKEPNAYKVVKFKIDGEGTLQQLDQPKEPMLFYSRPKGDYVGEDAKDILLDFYLVNVDLAKDSLQVVAEINGQQKVNIDQWQPYLVTGLPMGKNSIKLSLAKQDGSSLPAAPFTTVTREFRLGEQEPLQ